MQMKLSTALAAVALGALAQGLQAAPAAPPPAVTDKMIENDAANGRDVLSWGLGTQGQRYSPLRQVNTRNVGKLVPAWAFSFGGEKQRGQESQPVVHNGRMFVTASYSRLFALDAATGRKLWKYEHRLPDGIMPCCDVINRGAALYDNLVIFGTLDAQLVALDQGTGEVVWKEKVDDYAAGYSMSAAPLIVNGLVLTGVLMTLAAFATLSPAIADQFNLLIGWSVALFMLVYGLAALALIREARAIADPGKRLAARAVAVLALLFSAWIVVVWIGTL